MKKQKTKYIETDIPIHQLKEKYQHLVTNTQVQKIFAEQNIPITDSEAENIKKDLTFLAEIIYKTVKPVK